jgi:hypothetical protein
MAGREKMLAVIGVSMNPGADRVGADALSSVVDGEILGEEHDAALGGVVGAAAGGAFESLDAGDVHEHAALPVVRGLPKHLNQRVLANEERSLEVHVEHPVPLAGHEHVHWPTARHPRSVHDGVEAAVLGHDTGHEAAHRSFVAHVEPRDTRRVGNVRAQRDGALGAKTLDAGLADA